MATTTASASGTGSSAAGVPITCTVRMPPRTSIEQRSVAPVKSSAIAPKQHGRSLLRSIRPTADANNPPWAFQDGRVCPTRQASLGHLAAQFAPINQPPQRLRQLVAVADRTNATGFRRDQRSGRAARGNDHRQTSFQSLGDRHAIAFVMRRQSEQIGAAPKPRPTPRQPVRRRNARAARYRAPRPARPVHARAPDPDPASQRSSDASPGPTTAPGRAAANRDPCAGSACRSTRSRIPGPRFPRRRGASSVPGTTMRHPLRRDVKPRGQGFRRGFAGDDQPAQTGETSAVRYRASIP